MLPDNTVSEVLNPPPRTPSPQPSQDSNETSQNPPYPEPFSSETSTNAESTLSSSSSSLSEVQFIQDSTSSPSIPPIAIREELSSSESDDNSSVIEKDSNSTGSSSSSSSSSSSAPPTTKQDAYIKEKKNPIKYISHSLETYIELSYYQEASNKPPATTKEFLTLLLDIISDIDENAIVIEYNLDLLPSKKV